MVYGLDMLFLLVFLGFALMGIEARTTTADPYGMTNREGRRQKRRGTAEAATEADLPLFGEGCSTKEQQKNNGKNIAAMIGDS